jgi:hypothetical protein
MATELIFGGISLLMLLSEPLLPQGFAGSDPFLQDSSLVILNETKVSFGKEKKFLKEIDF